MYPVDGRASPVRSSLHRYAFRLENRDRACGFRRRFSAENYDRLVDSPVEIGAFQESDFDEGGGHYRVVVDADPADYDMQQHRRHAARAGCRRHCLDGRPTVSNLCFHLSFSARPRGGGMEHAYSTAIDISAQPTCGKSRCPCRSDRARVLSFVECETHPSAIA